MRLTRTGAAHEQQRASGPDLAGGIAGDPQRQEDVLADGEPRLLELDLHQRPIMRAGTRDHHMVDRSRQFEEESLERSRIVGVEGRAAERAELACGVLQALGVPAVRMTSAPSARARRAVSSPMPALPPITTTVCPRSSGSCWVREAKVAVFMISPISIPKRFAVKSVRW